LYQYLNAEVMRSILIIFLLITGVTFTYAQQAGPVLAFETETIDYGTIPHKSDGLREFKFTNTGGSPLVITNAKGSCGCTVPTWPREAIAPGESGTIQVRYATDRIGAFTKTVTLTTNATEPVKVLTIRGNILPPEPEGN
jgi:uncharacterized protein DUF1573